MHVYTFSPTPTTYPCTVPLSCAHQHQVKPGFINLASTWVTPLCSHVCVVQEFYVLLSLDKCTNGGVREFYLLLSLDKCTNGGVQEFYVLLSLDKCTNGGVREFYVLLSLDKCTNGGVPEHAAVVFSCLSVSVGDRCRADPSRGSTPQRRCMAQFITLPF